MDAVTVGSVVALVTAFFVAAEAPRSAAFAWAARLAAAALFVVTVLLLARGLPHAPVARLCVVGFTALTALACLWQMKRHLDHRRGQPATLAALLGLGLFALAFITHFAAAPPAPADPIALDTIAAQRDRLAQRERAIDDRLLLHIPQFRRRLEADAAQVRRELASASPEAKVRLHAELEEVARLLLALDREQHQSQALAQRLRQEQRRLERLEQSRHSLADDEPLRAELDEVWHTAGTHLARPIDQRLGSGALEQLEVDRKTQELLHAPPTP